METQNIENIREPKTHFVLNSTLIAVEFSMIISILIFCFFVMKGYSYLGHLPHYGDKEVISFDGYDRKMVIVMLYPLFFGVITWIILTFCGITLNLKRKRSAKIIGVILCLLNILIMFSSQLEWILD